MENDNLVEMRVMAVLFDVATKAPVVLLKDVTGKRILPIWIGHFEASVIQMEIEKIKPPRPQTHDLLKNVLDNLGAKVVKVTVNDLHQNTFLATILLRIRSQEIEIDSRPSDAIAIALKSNSPIFASEHILKEASIPEYITKPLSEEEEKEQFKKFLEQLKPEDFDHKH